MWGAGKIYDCGRCRDTWVVQTADVIARCDCPASKANQREMLRQAAEFFRKIAKQGRPK